MRDGAGRRAVSRALESEVMRDSARLIRMAWPHFHNTIDDCSHKEAKADEKGNLRGHGRGGRDGGGAGASGKHEEQQEREEVANHAGTRWPNPFAHRQVDRYL